MNDVDIQWFASLGVGGIIAAFMFLLYRKDTAQYIQILKEQTEANRIVVSQLLEVIRENTRAITKVETVVDSMHRRLDTNSKHFPQREDR